MRLGIGDIARDVRALAPLLQIAWATVEEDGSLILAPESGVVRLGGLGPGIELRRILDTQSDGTPLLDAGGEQQERWGIFLLGANGEALLSLLSGTAEQPNRATLLLLAGAPTSASDTGTKGELRADSSYLYYCTGTDTWKRVAISTW